jgi:diguanylate cyclase (GGDEF)-like protein
MARKPIARAGGYRNASFVQPDAAGTGGGADERAAGGQWVLGSVMQAGASPALDLASCEQEPIHIPNAIQPHGAFVALLADSLIVTHASANLAEVTGLDAAAVLGRPMLAALGQVLSQAVAAVMNGADGLNTGTTYTMDGPDRQKLHLHVFRSGRHIGVDIQPVREEPMMASADSLLRSAVESLRLATRSEQLCALTVHCLKAMTAYDRVMAYRFAADGHGEVIAETRQPHMEPYLGLHYPAADVPPQARRLFLRQPVCLISDAGQTPVALLHDSGSDDGTPLDLTLSALRSVSPIHRQYLRNMGVGASFTVALTKPDSEGAPSLWGMIVCHSTTPRIPGPAMQSVLLMIGRIVSMLLGSLEEAEICAVLMARMSILRTLVDRMVEPQSVLRGNEEACADLLTLVGASGALVHMGGTAFTIGRTPPLHAAEQALSVLRAQADGEVLAVNDLALRYPELTDCMAEGSGALLVPLPNQSEVLWFRPEMIRTVSWGGNPDLHASADPLTGRLSPRSSFAAWEQTVRGYGHPWAPAEMSIAREFCGLVEKEVAARASAALARLSRYDPLTGLPNRSFLQQRLGEQDRASAAPAALAFLDLDGFKAVNDSMGHQAGDLLLVEVARRLLKAAGAEGFVARLGGDEFVVLCHCLDHAEIEAQCERIRHLIAAPIEIHGRPCHVTASIGVALSGQCGSLDLIRAADMAMYVAKNSGGNRVLFFETSMFDQASQRFALEEDLRLALSRGDEFVLLYQPIFAVAGADKRLTGFEALVRWRHPSHGWMSPGVFIPLAEKSGLILPLGDWILAAALRQGVALRRADPEGELTINVNVSVLEITKSGFCAGVADALAAEGYPAGALCLEVVESLLADAAAGAALAEVRELGVQLAIDDFGIGFSSLSYLRRLPVETVKLDRSFLEDIEGEKSDTGFITAVVALAHAAGKKVVFEGIETDAQFDVVVGTNVDMVQGFFFAPPLSANAAMNLVLQHRQLRGHGAEQAFPDVVTGRSRAALPPGP